MWFDRKIVNTFNEVQQSRPVLLLTGARQVGKSSLLRRLFPEVQYVTLDRVLQAEQAEDNPSAFLAQFEDTAIIDEIQYAPSLFRELKIMVDENRQRYGQWLLTGSQQFQLMEGASESLAGRIGVLCLHTLCGAELRPYSNDVPLKDLVWKGGYPELWANPKLSTVHFFESYVQTYLERDLKTIIQVKNLRDFNRFLRAAAIRVGNLVNMNDMAKDVGVTNQTIKTWLHALETSGLITLLPPYYRNMGKRLIKAPKLYFNDTGLLCHLLDIERAEDYQGHLHGDAIWENFVFCELMKSSKKNPG